MWKNKIFESRDEMNEWLAVNGSKIQYNEIFLNHTADSKPYGIQYRPLMRIC